MTNIIKSIPIALLALGLWSVNAAAATVTFKNAVLPFRQDALAVDISLGHCAVDLQNVANGGTFYGNNAVLCTPDLVSNPANSVWGYGVAAAIFTLSGTVSGTDGAPITNPGPNNIVNFTGVHVNDPTGVDTPPGGWIIPTCVHVEQNNQGVKLAVIRGLTGTAEAPNFFTPTLVLIEQDQNGNEYMAASFGAVDSSGNIPTTCTPQDAVNVQVAQAYTPPYCPPLPSGFTSDNLFNLLSKTTSGNITLKK